MTRRGTPRHRGRRATALWIFLAAVLLLVGSGALIAGVLSHPKSLAVPASPRRQASTTPTSATPSTTPPSTTPPLLARSAPVLLQVPAIGLSVSVSTLGLNRDGTVQVPTDVQQPGWFRLGPSPGQLGSAVILGHVDSYQGPAVFFRLRSLQAGDRVDTALADGETAHFVVTAVVMYPKSQFPDRKVYGSHGYSALQLVTCGGTFDRQTGHYLSNVVVYTSLVGVATAASPSDRIVAPA